MAQCLISIKWCINIFTEYSALFTSTHLVGLVSHSYEIIKNAEWQCVQETVQCPKRRQHMVLGILLIQVFDWLVRHCHPTVNQTFAPLNKTTRLKTIANINIHDGPMFFLQRFYHVVFVLHRTDSCVSCECQDNLQFDSFVVQATPIKVVGCYSCYCNSFYFPNVSCITGANNCRW